MADVYKAIDETLGRTVAVKVMHAKYASDTTFTQRFRQEAQAAANLQSPNIVNIYDWGQEGNYYYIVMEYVRGTDLKTLIQQKGALPSRQVAEIGAQVCSALSVAHGYDVIHRDIKPHNIMVAPDGMVKVMDFGIAQAGNTTMTQTGSVLGTAHYVSPEQAQGRELTSVSDLYSLGVVLYEASCGRLPFDAETPVAVALKQVNEQAQRPSRINPGIDTRLEQIIGRAMAKDPRARYATAEEMRKDLQRIIEGGNTRDETMLLPGDTLAGSMRDDATTMLPHASENRTTVMPTVSGYEVTSRRAINTAQVAQDKKQKRALIIGAVIVAILIIGGCLAYAVYSLNAGGIVVPDVRNKTLEEATALLKMAEFEVGEPKEEYDPEVPKGKVISQDPKENSRAEKGTTVILTISRGKEMVEVPDIVDMTEAEAQKALKDKDFVPDPQPGKSDSKIEAGKIISQDPEAGKMAEKGSKVAYIPSLGAKTVAVPDVVNKSEADAREILESKKLKVERAEDYSDSVSAGCVIAQNPKAGLDVKQGTTVTITISLGKKVENVTVPPLVGLSLGAAQTTLSNNGLLVSIVYEKTTDSKTVVGQNPSAGTKVPKGSTVTITVDMDSP